MKKSDLTPLEAAEITSYKNWADRLTMLAIPEPCSKDRDALLAAACILRKIAAGEYKRVMHAHWEQKDCSKWPICSNCGKPTLSRGYCPAHSNYCPSCGALMDESDMRQTQGGKDDSHE